MTFELGKSYIVNVTEKGIIPLMEFDRSQWFNKDCDDLEFLTDEEKEVIVNEALNQIRAEIKDTLYVDSLIFGELIDFRNGKISADDVIEEFNRVTRIEVLKILDKYKEESEVEDELLL